MIYQNSDAPERGKSVQGSTYLFTKIQFVGTLLVLKSPCGNKDYTTPIFTLPGTKRNPEHD